ncbi:MAG: hypothetical protein LBH19_06150, partial [Dysgonamonadaceae bacterium]|nr:hypothetical protein [Dysgonamonadaceae bacterium]
MDKKANISFNISAILTVILFCFAVTPVYFQNDTFYSIKIGRYILENGVDMNDHFSWHNDLPYTYPHWAYDTLLGFLYNIGGFAAVCLSTIVFACILGITLYFVNCSLTKNRTTSLVFTLLIMFLLGELYLTARAQLVSYILFILEFLCIEKFLKTKHFGYAAGLVVIATVLANVHIAVWPFFFVIFLPYIGEYLLAKFGIKSFSRIIIKKNKLVPLLMIIFVICLFTGLLTPLGFSPYTYLFDTITGPSLGYINEHKSLLILTSLKFLSVLVIFGIFLFLTTIEISIKNLLMLGGLLTLAISGQRHFSLLAIIGMTIYNLLVSEYLEE